MNSPEKIPIILVAFGTSTKARDTYRHFEEQCREAFPGSDIRWAYTSQFIRRKLKQEEGLVQQSLFQVLDGLEAEGHKRAVVQSLHIIPGTAFHGIFREAGRHPLKTVVGRPLLSGGEDIEKTVDALIPWLPKADETATLLIGHGTDHPASALYFELNETIRERGLRNVFFGNVNGRPSGEKALEAARNTGMKRIHFIPFMFVAGDHIENDIMGDDEDSWKSRLSGFACTLERRGLGWNEGVVEIFLAHLREAMEEL